ncbi:subtilase-type proteinase Rrt12p [Monosporozyma servazzii]
MMQYNKIILVIITILINSVIGEDEYLITFKETMPQFMNSLNDNIQDYILPKISKTFQIGSLHGISLNVTRDYIDRIKNNRYVKDIIPNFKVDALTSEEEAEEEMNIQMGAPRHLARISSKRQLPFDFDDIQKYKTMFNYYYHSWNQGSGIRSYILDTGIDSLNAEFENRVEQGFDCTGEGFGDFNGHGTHVAGIVGSRTFGVAKNITLVDVKCLDGMGQGTLISVISALEWVVNDCHEHRNSKCVANLSLGSLKTQILNDAIDEAVKNGVVIVVAAGNYNMNACWVSPASSMGAITVGAFDDRFDSIAKFSNWGPCVDIFAPGVSIASVVSQLSGNDTKRRLLQRYVAYSGTSMASPSVCGLVALLLEEGVAVDKIKETLIARSVGDVFHRRTLMFKPNTPNRVVYNGLERVDGDGDDDFDVMYPDLDIDVLVKELNEYEAGSSSSSKKKQEAVKVRGKDGKTKIVYLDNDLCLPIGQVV